MATQQEIQRTGLGAGLCLHPPGCCPAGSTCSTTTLTERRFTAAPSRPKSPLDVSDPTELKAKEILDSAQRESGEPRGWSELAAVAGDSGVAAKPATAAYPRGPVLGLSMKGSLRRFLEKRAARLRQASGSPYSTTEKPQSACPWVSPDGLCSDHFSSVMIGSTRL